MEHLDLEGMLSSTSATWLLPAFDQQDAIFLSSSRQMLEPIMEETSEDEDNQNWSQYENAWSSESDTGSVIRIELHNEQDTVSERDLACPAKRPRRSEDLLIFEESAPMHVHHHQPQASQSQPLHSPQTRKFYRNDNIFSANDVSDSYRKRFDELCSDSDSLSYNSLSRSSSLIQFESLERQFQNDLSSLGNSSPSLLSFIENEELAKQGSESSLRRYESSEGRLHQTYFNLDKIDFTNGLIFSENSQNHNYQLKSDSESSDNSILSHEERIPKMNVSQLNTNDQRISHKTGKSSAENLSEDSGYGEYSTGLRAKSKSIPNFLRTCDKFCEEDEFEHRKSLELIYKDENSKNIVSGSAASLRSRQENKEHFSKNCSTESTATKIDRNNELKLRKMSPLPSLAAGNLQHQLHIAPRTEFFTVQSDQPHAQRQFYNKVEDAAKVSDDHDNDQSDDNSDSFSEEDNDCGKYYEGSFKNKPHPSECTTLPSSSHISVSLPDVRIQYNHEFDDGNNCSDPRSCDYRRTLGSTYSNYHNDEQYTSVSSLPENLNLFGLSEKSSSDGVLDCTLKPNDNFVISSSERIYGERDDCVWNSRSPVMLTRSENRLEDKYFGFLANFPSGKPSSQKVQSFHLNYMNASYNNLTLLDYSGRSKSFTMSDYNSGGNSKRNSREMDLGKGNFLLDELSAHFDRNLSIISDRARDSDLVSEFINNEKYNHNKNEKPAEDPNQVNKRSKVPPKPPIRRSSMKKDPSTTETDIHLEVPALPPCMNKTFDLDPTNLKTTYAESLEKCNFDPKELSSTDLTVLTSSRNEHYRQTSAPLKRGFVASTPNLNTFRSNPDQLNKLDDEMHVSSAHTSMNRLPGEKKLGILMTSSSRNSLGKGVSFCPIVSEISWRDQSSDECVEPDSLENVHHDDHLASSEDDSEFSDDDDDDDGGFADRQRNPEQLITVAVTTATSLANNNSNNPQLDSNTSNKIEVKAEITNRNASVDAVIASNSNDNHNTSSEEHKQRKKSLHEPSGSGAAEEQRSRLISMKTGPNARASNSSIAQQSSGDGGDLSVLINSRSVEGNSKFYCDYSVPSVRDSVSKRQRNDEMIFEKSESVISDAKIQNNSKTVSKNSINTKAVKVSKTRDNIVDDMPNSRNTGTNTGTDLLKQKFMVKPDEKHHKNGFLSRFAGGFRFSLRRKKKPTPVVEDDKNSNDNASRIFSKNKKAPSSGGSPVKNNLKTSDVVHIPLHASVDERDLDKSHKANITSSEEILSTPYAGNVERNGRHLSDFTPNYIDSSNHVLLLGKPPLPKQPPRVVGVCEKIRACQSAVPIGPYDRHAHASHNTIHKTREIDGRFLDNERQYYRNQFDGTMNESGSSSNNNILPPPPSFAETDNNRPLYTSQISDSIAVGKNVNANDVAHNAKHKIGLIETNLDTHETIITGKTRSLMELGPQVRLQLHKQNPGTCHQHESHIDDGTSRRPHKSMEFLLDKENQKNVLVSFGNSAFQKPSWLRKALNHIKPPENELQKTHDSTAALSEHQLRVQASLQRLNIPDWFRQYSSTPKPATETAYKPGAFTRKRASDSGRWAGLNSKTTSLSSLGSQRSDRSPLMLSPSAHSHTGAQIGFSRWSTSHLNSTQTSPSISTRGSFSRGGVANSSFMSGHSVGSASIRSSFRQPYLGWRSQEKLSQPRTPHERLASSLLAQQQQSPKPEPVVTPEIQSSIKEVTSAIVHYVNDQTNRTSRSRSTSPNSRRCWLESSFVGIRPLESPQTPVIDNNSFNTTVTPPTHSATTSDGGFRMNGVGESTMI